MNIYWFTILFTLWYALSLYVSGKIGNKRKIGEEWSFFICMVFSPVIGLIVSLSFPPYDHAPGEENGT